MCVCYRPCLSRYCYSFCPIPMNLGTHVLCHTHDTMKWWFWQNCGTDFWNFAFKIFGEFFKISNQKQTYLDQQTSLVILACLTLATYKQLGLPTILLWLSPSSLSFCIFKQLNLHSVTAIESMLMNWGIDWLKCTWVVLWCRGAVASTAVKLKLRECLLNKSQRELSNISNSPPEFRQWSVFVSRVSLSC